MLYVDKLLSTPFRVLARMVDTLACRRVEMLLAETLQVQLMYGFAFFVTMEFDVMNSVLPSYKFGLIILMNTSMQVN